MRLSSLDRRLFLRGTGVALALPWFESLARAAEVTELTANRKRLACFYMPDGVPMPLAEDPAYKDWAWFPHGNGSDFTFTKCLEPLETLRKDLTVLSGLSHPAARSIHGHSNADQFLTGAPTGAAGDYRNSISLDQVFAAHVGDQTRFSSLSCLPTAVPEHLAVHTRCLSIEMAVRFRANIVRSVSSTCCL